MTFTRRISALVAFLGLASFSPIAYSKVSRWIQDNFNAPPDPQPNLIKEATKEFKKAVDSPQEQIQKIIEKEKYDGCSVLNARSNALWFVCSKKENSHKPSLYNYNRSRQIPKSTVMKVIAISASAKTLTLSDQSTKKFLLSPFFWLGKVGGEIRPESDCNFKEEGSGDNPSYTLTCKNQEVQKGIYLEKNTTSQKRS